MTQGSPVSARPERPLQGPIVATDASRTFDRRSERLPWAWVRVGRAAATPAVPAHRPVVEEESGPAGPARIVGLPSAAHPLTERLRAWAHRERVYLLAGPSVDGTFLRQHGRTPFLARRLADGFPPFWVAADGSAGAIEVAGCWIVLDGAQAQQLREAAVHLWWQVAEYEAVAGTAAPRAAEWRPALERPFDAPYAPQGPLALVPPGEGRSLGPWRCRVDGEDGKPTVFFAEPGPDAEGSLVADVRAGARVLHVAGALPVTHLSGSGGTAIVGPDGGWRLEVTLTPEQGRALAERLRQRAGEADAELHANVSLGELVGREVWLSGRPGFERVEARVELDAGELHAPSLEAMAGAEPSSWPEAPGPCVQKVVRWRVVPPMAPKGARRDPLVEQWEALDRDAQARLRCVGEQLDRVEGRGQADAKGKLARWFARRWNGLLRRVERLREQAEGLAEQPPSSLGPAGAAALVRSLEALERQVVELGGDVRKAREKAALQAEEARQRAEYEERQRRARQRLEGLSAQFERVEQELAEARARLEELQAREEPTAKKGRKQRAREIHAAKKRVGAVERELERLRREREEQQAVLEEPFEFRPPRKAATLFEEEEPGRAPAGRDADEAFVPAAPRGRTGPAVPSEALPRVGVLLRYGETRYLVIERWEEWAAAREEAGRLGAQVVAARDMERGKAR